MIQNEETGRMTVVRPTRPAAGATQPVEAAHEQVDVRPFANLADWRMHWGPIVAGLLAALTAMTLLGLLGAAIGLTALTAAQGAPPDTGRNAAVWGGISTLLSFLLGGYVASRTAGLLDRGWGAWHGVLVFMLAVPVLLWLASQGLGALVGGLSGYAASFNLAYLADQARVNPADAARAAAAARGAAWGTFVGVLLGLGSGAIGGYLGVHHTLT
ncbi:MAG TPA: hypothetical protein VGL23_24460, partial [Chloroflexota bacterium]